MSLTIYCVNNLNEVTKKLDFKPLGPFDFNTIIYQNAGARELITFELTNKNGITANLNYATLQQWIGGVAKSIGYNPKVEPLVWKILGLLKKLDTRDYPILNYYLEDELRGIQLAEKLAGIFDDYISYNVGEVTGWQKEILVQLTDDDFQIGAIEFIKNNLIDLNLSSLINIIGLDFITPIQYELVKFVAKVTDINFYFVYPSSSQKGDFTSYWKLKNNTLKKLESLGKVNFCLDTNLTKTVLTKLQKGDFTPKENDDSVIIVNAYSKKREVQELYNFILYQCENRGVKPFEVQILCPKIADYKPYIDAVFLSDDFPVKLPYYISDVPAHGFTQKVDIVLDSILLDKNISLKLVSTYLENRLIQKKYQISDYGEAIEYLKRTAFISGDESDSTNELSLIGWEQSKKRLIYGLTMFTTEYYDGVMPFDEAEGKGSFQIIGVVNLINDLFEWATENTSKTFNNWFKIFAFRYNHFFGNEDEDVNYESHQIWPLFEGLYDSNKNISAQIFHYMVSNQLDSYGKSRKRFTNGITVSDLGSNRGISRKVTCMIGLNDQSFPRREVEFEFDFLKAKNKRVSKKQIDMLDFYSGIQSAQQTLYFSYIGTNTKNNSKLLPSIFLSETIDQLKRIIKKSADTNLVTKHPASVNSSFYTNKKHEPFTYIKIPSKSNLRSLITDEIEHLSRPNSLPLDELIKYFKNTSKWFYNNRLNVSLFDKDESIAENESFAIDNLKSWGIRNTFLQELELDIDEIKKRKKQNLQLPLGGFGDSIFYNETNGIQLLKEELIRVSSSTKVDLNKVSLRFRDLELMGGKKSYLTCEQAINYNIFWLPKVINLPDSEIGKYIIDIAFLGAYLSASGVANEIRFYFINENQEVNYKVFDFSNSDLSKSWLEDMIEIYLNQPNYRPIYFYPKLCFSEIGNPTVPMGKLYDHFNNNNERSFPDDYQQRAFFQSIQDNGIDKHEELLQRDWDLLEKFWSIIKETK